MTFNLMDAKDWYVMLHFGGMMTAATVFVFMHPEHFPAYCMLAGTAGGVFHALLIHDDKVPDAIPSDSEITPG